MLPSYMGPSRVYSQPEKIELISIDFIGPFMTGRAGLQKILVTLAVFTKYVTLFPVKRNNTKISIRCIL